MACTPTWNESGELIYHGEILGEVKDGIFLIEIYSFYDGSPTQLLIDIRKMLMQKDSTFSGWHFYDTFEELENAYTNYNKRRS